MKNSSSVVKGLALVIVLSWAALAWAQEAPQANPPPEQPPAAQPAQPAEPPAQPAQPAEEKKEEPKPAEQPREAPPAEPAPTVQPEVPAPQPAQPPAQPEAAPAIPAEKKAEEPKPAAPEEPKLEVIEETPAEELKKEDAAEEEETPAGAEANAWGGLVIFDNSLGIGTFVKNDYAANPNFVQQLSLRPNYKLMGVTTELRFDIDYEYTDVDNASGRKVTPYDLLLSFSKAGIYKEDITGIEFGGMVRFGFPVSYESRFEGRYLALTLNPQLGRTFLDGALRLDYSFRYAKYFTKYKSRVVDPSESDDYPLAYGRSGGAENVVGGLAIGGRARSYYLYNEGAITWTINDQWAVYLDLIVLNYFNYPIEKDEYSVPQAKSGGRTDNTWGTAAVDFSLTKALTFEFGVTSLQPAKTADNKSLRFPFFDFVGEAGNLTAWYLDVLYTFGGAEQQKLD